MYKTSRTCFCEFFMSYASSGKHAFAVRDHQQIDLLDEEMIEPRWSREHYVSQGVDPSIDSNTDAGDVHPEPAPRRLHWREKLNRCMEVSHEISRIAAGMGMEQYSHVIQQLESLKELTASGQSSCSASW